MDVPDLDYQPETYIDFPPDPNLKFYAIAIGREPGIYTSWDECLKQTRGVFDNYFKSFYTEEEAVQWLASVQTELAAEQSDPTSQYIIYSAHSSKEIKTTPGAACVLINTEDGEVNEYNIKARMENFTGIEMSLLVHVLRLLPVGSSVTVFSCTSYICNAFRKHWLDTWICNGWRAGGGLPVQHIDLWKLLSLEVDCRTVAFRLFNEKVNDPMISRCSNLADQTARGLIASSRFNDLSKIPVDFHGDESSGSRCFCKNGNFYEEKNGVKKELKISSGISADYIYDQMF